MVVNLLKSLFPKGSPWNLLGEFGKLITGIGISIERVYLYARETLNESNPRKANEEIKNWYDALGIKEENIDIDTKRKLLSANYSGSGGQSRQYIESKIQEVLPNINILEFTIPLKFMVGLGVSGVVQVTDYPTWIPLVAKNGTYPVYYYQVTGKVSNVTEYLILQDLIKRYAPLTHIPVYVNINFYNNTGMVGVGQAGISETGRNQT